MQRPGGGEGDRERQRERETDRERKRERQKEGERLRHTYRRSGERLLPYILGGLGERDASVFVLFQ